MSAHGPSPAPEVAPAPAAPVAAPESAPLVDALGTDRVLAPFIAAHDAALRRFDRYGFAMPEPGRVQIVPRIVGSAQFPDTPGANGAPSPAERRDRWSKLKTMVHEYVHPSFIAARGGNRVLFEGSASCSPRRS